MFFCFVKIAQWKIFKTSFPTKKVILIFVTSLKTATSSRRWFFTIFFRKRRVFLKRRLGIRSACVPMHLVMPCLVNHPRHLTKLQAASPRSPGLRRSLKRSFCVRAPHFRFSSALRPPRYATTALVPFCGLMRKNRSRCEFDKRF